MQSTISDMAFDSNNFCWIGFPNGIQKFDGKNFVSIPVQAGLPDDKQVLFFKCSNGDLLLSHVNGISKYQLSTNSFLLIYKYDVPEKMPAQFVCEDAGVVYFYSQNAIITGLRCNTFQKVVEAATGLPGYATDFNYRPRISQNIINHKTALIVNGSAYLWNLAERKMLFKSEPLPGISSYLLRLKTENEILYFTNIEHDALQSYNFISKKNTSLRVTGKDESPISRCIYVEWQNKILVTFNNRLYETDSTLQVLKAEIVNFKNQSVAGLQSIAGIKQDNFGNLFLQTISGGIKKIIHNNYPFKYYSTGKPDSNFVVNLLADKTNNRIFACTSNNGLLVFDTAQRLIKHIKTIPGQNSPTPIAAIVKKKQGGYLIYVVGERRIWHLSADLSTLTSSIISTSLPSKESGFNYFANPIFQNDQEVVLQSQAKLYRTNLATNATTEHLITSGYVMSGILFNNYIVTHANDELIYLDAQTFKEVKKVPFKNTGYVRCFALSPVKTPGSAAEFIYVGSNKGIFKIDAAGKVLQHLNKETGLPDECIYAMVFDEQGILWCSTNKGLLKINTDNSIHHFKKEDGLQENEFNTNAVSRAEDGEIFFAGVNGISSFYPAAIGKYDERIHLFFTKVKVNNEEFATYSAAWNISNIDLPHTQNSLSFDFIAMGNTNPGQYIYQYKMEGVDKQWIQNEDLQTVRYYLQPGKYTFKIYAGRSFNKDAIVMKEILITIHPPFYKTWWFVLAVSAAVLFLMGLLFNQYNKNKYRKTLDELKAANRLQEERERISRDLHDSIGAYANAVLYSTELLENEKEVLARIELMKDLKFASKDIITSLRETIWALKKDNYTTEECIIRIRNFVQTLSKHYPHINFSIEGEGSADEILHYTKALNVVRILQEAVTNAIKHSNSTNISIKSSRQAGQWLLEVNDDGIGFSEENLDDAGRGYGLANMKERAAEAAFDLKITTAPGAGTSLVITV